MVIEEWLAANETGTACVISDGSFPAGGRVASLTPVEAKGLEFDLVVLVDSPALGHDLTAVVDRYVAMTRATQQLVILGGDRTAEPARQS